MSFESLRAGKPSRSSKCNFCNKAERDGTVTVAIKDKDAKTVISRNEGACESCAVKRYEATIASLTAARADTSK